MTDFSFVVGVVKFAANHIQGMAKSGDVDEAVVERENQGTCKQPDQHERHLTPSPNGNGEEDDAHDGIGHGFHHRIDAVVYAVLRVGEPWHKGQQEKGNTWDHEVWFCQT